METFFTNKFMGGSACRISPNHSITEFSLLNALLIPDTLPQLSERAARTRQLATARLLLVCFHINCRMQLFLFFFLFFLYIGEIITCLWDKGGREDEEKRSLGARRCISWCLQAPVWTWLEPFGGFVSFVDVNTHLFICENLLLSFCVLLAGKNTSLMNF